MDPGTTTAIVGATGAVIAAVVSGVVLVFRIFNDQVAALWAENRQLRKELDESREDTEICKARSAELVRENRALDRRVRQLETIVGRQP